jgi:hypothetical protein
MTRSSTSTRSGLALHARPFPVGRGMTPTASGWSSSSCSRRSSVGSGSLTGVPAGRRDALRSAIGGVRSGTRRDPVAAYISLSRAGTARRRLPVCLCSATGSRDGRVRPPGAAARSLICAAMGEHDVVPAPGCARSPPGAVAHAMSQLPQQSVSASHAARAWAWSGLRNALGALVRNSCGELPSALGPSRARCRGSGVLRSTPGHRG